MSNLDPVAIPALPFPRLLRSRNLLDLWLVRMVARLCAMQEVLNKDQDLVVQLVEALRLDPLEATTSDAICLWCERLSVTHRMMEARRARYRFPATLQANLSLVARHVGLGEAARQILALAALLRGRQAFREIGRATRGAADVAEQIAHVLAIPAKTIIRQLLHAAPLIQSNLIYVSSGNCLGGNLHLAHGSLRRLASDRLPDVRALLAGIVRSSQATNLPLESYRHLSPPPDSIVSFLAACLDAKRTGANILLYGRPGTGKTELSRVLARELAIPLFEVETTDTDGDTHVPMRRLRCAATAQVLLKHERALLVFDEIDGVFTDGSEFFGKPTTAETAKAWVNDLLETNPVPTIWIANRINGMDPAFIRRFDLVIEAGVPPQAARLALLERECAFLEPAQARRLSLLESATPAVILRAAGTVKRMGDSIGDPAVALDQVINGVLRAQRLPTVEQQCRNAPEATYDPSLCNADADLQALAHGLCRSPRGRLCLYGPAGTGKTAFGLWLAQQLGRPLHLKRVSDVQSPYLGETERNLARTFESAMHEGAVLQIDEVDSFLQDRRQARHAWELSQVNEFLMQLESYSGLFIASTNLHEGLDPASLRRFDFKIHMNYLAPDQVSRLLKTLIHDLSLDEATAGRHSLTHLTRLTPGDFAVVRRQHQTRPFRRIDELVQALSQEQALKVPPSRRIGFV